MENKLENVVEEQTVETVVAEHDNLFKKMKSFSKKKIILGAVGAVLACILLAVVVVLFSSGIQMKFMTNYVMKNIRDYNWSALQMEDPVKPGLAEAFGAQQTESIDLLYNYMKDAAAETSWEIKEVNKKDLTVTVDVKYTDRSGFLKEYAERIGDYIVAGLDSGAIQFSDVMNVLNTISDEENKKLLNASMEHLYETSLGISDRKATTLTVNFEKNGLFCIPTGTSDEVNNVASAGMFENIDSMTSVVAARIIPQIIDHVFLAIQTFDEDEIQKYTGKKISEYLDMKEDNKLYTVLYEYLRACSSKMSYEVGAFDQSTGEIPVECTYLDSKNVITTFVRLLAKESLGSLFSKNPKKIDIAEVLKQATESSTEEMVSKTVVISLDTNNYSDIKISDEIYDVVSANLYSEMSELAQYLK